MVYLSGSAKTGLRIVLISNGISFSYLNDMQSVLSSILFNDPNDYGASLFISSG